MARIYVSRENSMFCKTGIMNCYINNKCVCSLKNEADAAIDFDGGVIEFKCHIPGNALSNIYYINLTERRLIAITVKQGALGPQISISDQSAVIKVVHVNGVDHSQFTEGYFAESKPVTDSNSGSGLRPFIATKIVGDFAIDESSRQWAVAKGIFSSFKNVVPYKYSDIIDYELIEDGSSITKGGVGRAVAGAFLFGSVGAVVGAVTGGKKAKQTCTSLMIKITVNDISCPVIFIKMITSETAKSSFLYRTQYKKAQEIIALLQIICNEQADTNNINTIKQPNSDISSADEIRKYKQLMDEGIISAEEFEAKKKHLLGI